MRKVDHVLCRVLHSGLLIDMLKGEERKCERMKDNIFMENSIIGSHHVPQYSL